MTSSVNLKFCDSAYQSDAVYPELKEIFGYQPTVKVAMDELNRENGVFIKIFGVANTYTVYPAKFSKKVNSSKIKGDGLFEGPWDVYGEQIAKFFFVNHSEGSIVYLNSEQRKILKNEDGTIDFEKIGQNS